MDHNEVLHFFHGQVKIHKVSRNQSIKRNMLHSTKTMETRTYFEKQTFNDSQFSVKFVKAADVKKQKLRK